LSGRDKDLEDSDRAARILTGDQEGQRERPEANRLRGRIGFQIDSLH
jgi:hypothetical protein